MSARILLATTLIAPVAACIALSPLIADLKMGPLEMERFDTVLLPLIFAIPGSIALLLVFLLLRRGTSNLRVIYPALIILGGVAGGGMLSNYEAQELRLGILYGLGTAFAWVFLHVWMSGRAAAPSEEPE